jgi:hypothetical protein
MEASLKIMLAGRRMAELERIWKEAIVAFSRYFPGICPEGLRKFTTLG